MTTHVLKSWPQFFDPILSGRRRHDLRRNDRTYMVDDILRLEEYDPTTGLYTGRTTQCLITSITSADIPCAVSREALNDDFCIISLTRFFSEDM